MEGCGSPSQRIDTVFGLSGGNNNVPCVKHLRNDVIRFIRHYINGLLLLLLIPYNYLVDES